MKLSPVPSPRVANLWHGLLKEIFLQDGNAGELAETFFIGYGDSDDPFDSRIGVSWRRSKKYARLERALALAIRRDTPELSGTSLDDFVRGISATLKDNALNRSLVNTIFARSSAMTLHSVYSEGHPRKIAEVLWKRFVRYILAELDAWLFVYPLERVTTETGSFSCGDFCVLSAADQATYLKYCENFPELRSLDLATGALGQDVTLTKAPTSSWLLIVGYGTGDSVIGWGKQRASFFIGALFSAIRVQPIHSALVASSTEANNCVTLISAGNTACSSIGTDCGPILHSVVGTITVSPQALVVTARWLNQCSAADPSSRKRAETAAKWINQAAFHRDHVRFLFFFFAIDALFGVRSDVERSIVRGVQSRMFGDWSQRCEWLFELRSELVHGGSASFREWRRYEKYRTHYQSEPEDDVEEIAATCLIHFYSCTGA